MVVVAVGCLLEVPQLTAAEVPAQEVLGESVEDVDTVDAVVLAYGNVQNQTRARFVAVLVPPVPVFLWCSDSSCTVSAIYLVVATSVLVPQFSRHPILFLPVRVPVLRFFPLPIDPLRPGSRWECPERPVAGSSAGRCEAVLRGRRRTRRESRGGCTVSLSRRSVPRSRNTCRCRPGLDPAARPRSPNQQAHKLINVFNFSRKRYLKPEISYKQLISAHLDITSTLSIQKNAGPYTDVHEPNSNLEK